MAAITGVTSKLLHLRKLDASIGIKENKVSLLIGDGTSTYPTGGIPVTLNNLGLVNTLEALFEVGLDSALGTPTGYVYKFDYHTMKLMIFVTGASSGAALAQLANTATPQVQLSVYARGY